MFFVIFDTSIIEILLHCLKIRIPLYRGQYYWGVLFSRKSKVTKRKNAIVYNSMKYKLFRNKNMQFYFKMSTSIFNLKYNPKLKKKSITFTLGLT